MDNYDYGIIGNCQSAALVSNQGSIDWLCLPNFEAGSIFAKMLDDKKGGCFAIVPEGQCATLQQYIPRTNILSTIFEGKEWSFELIDFMPRYHDYNGSYHNPPDVIRILKLISGKPRFKIFYDPKINYGEFPTITIRSEDYLKSYSAKGAYESIYLYSSIPLEVINNGQYYTLEKNEFCNLSYNQKIVPLDMDNIELELELTRAYWMSWVSMGNQFSKYNAEIQRSSLVLKLLSFQNTGAILAAATTSLPETIKDVRNWDYRFCWIRDASMTIRILNQLGHVNVAERFLNFILNIIPYKDEKIQIMYGINGQKELPERELSWLAGYQNSKPVRIGNAAYIQKQDDIYGVLMDMIYEYLLLYRNNALHNIEDLWTVVRTLARHVINNWDSPDQSIWEFRSNPQHFTLSKVLCWVALDRGAKIASLFNKADYAKEWEEHSRIIKEDILKNGWNEELGFFTQSYHGTNCDASNLLMEHYGFIDASDSRYVSTVKKTYENLCKDGLMFRYINEDDFGKPKSAFLVCTFWMIKSLYRIGDKQLAVEMFDNILKHSNHLGLFSEGLDIESKRLLGNFPQAYSHLALIDLAMVLNSEK
ncbi:MAG: glycoside hydrolase family 15 protein [Candidatus Omnitrophica bacterium]|nr:glycoside hydrolase family 15 protein [Candidatus Omnitrophota bacterium]